jgi:hypothetical protein
VTGLGEPLTYLDARKLAEDYAGEDEKVAHFFRDDDLWRVRYARKITADWPPHVDPITRREATTAGAYIIVREEIVGPVKRPA